MMAEWERNNRETTFDWNILILDTRDDINWYAIVTTLSFFLFSFFFETVKWCLSRLRNVTISRQAGMFVAPILYSLQAEPMACVIRGTDEIKRMQMPGSGNVLESKICMFVDDTQFFLLKLKNQLNRTLKF